MPTDHHQKENWTRQRDKMQHVRADHLKISRGGENSLLHLNEPRAKNAFMVHFINVLSYNVFDPTEVMPTVIKSEYNNLKLHEYIGLITLFTIG